METEQQATAGRMVREGAACDRFLTFHLAGEEYGIDIMRVQEIIGVVPTRPVPTAPPYCRGVINLRGHVIPAIDLRLKLGMEGREDTDRTCIVIVELGEGDARNHFGVVVDEVAEVVDIPSGDQKPAPDFGTVLDAGKVQGIGTVKGSLKILLDIEKVLADGALPGLEA